MNTSTILSQFLTASETVSLANLWKLATGDIWENNIQQYDDPIALYLNDKGEFFIVTYITAADQAWKQAFECQNATWFIGYVSESDLIDGSVTAMLQDRIDLLQEQEDNFSALHNL